MPTPAIQFPAAQNPVQTAVQTDPQSARAGSGAPAPVLDGPGVRVSVTGTQLDKLVAKVKGESEDARLATAKRRIAIVLTVLSALNVKISESQKNNLAQIEALQSQIDELAKLLSGKDGSLTTDQARVAALEAQIEGLKKAVANAIKEGEEHRKQVEELKKTRAADDAELKKAEAALAKSEAALAAAQANLSKARADLDSAKQTVEADKKEIAAVKSQVEGLEKKVAECVAAVGDKTLAALAAGLRVEAPEVDPSEHTTNADREKEEAKAIANDPIRAIRAALDRMDADIRKTIEDNRTLLV
jgi:chromosome segregation ATPase